MKYILAAFLTVFLSYSIEGQSLKSEVEKIRETYHIPAIAYAVVTPDTVLEMEALGSRRADSVYNENKIAITDYFHIGSNTKAFTGFIAAYLVEKGKIEWKTKFYDLFPEWKAVGNPDFFDITLADLLSHRAGVKAYTSGFEYRQLPTFEGAKADQRMQFVRHALKEASVPFKEDSYAYSNAGYSAAALMLEKATNKTWEQLIDEIISEKLHLNYKFGWPNRYNVNQPWGHWAEKDSLVALSPSVDYSLSLGEPAGDLSLPLADYAKFIQLNLQGITGTDNLLKAETYHYLHFGFDSYAIGWGNVNSPKTQISEQVGSAGTFYCYALLDKRKKVAYVIICNSGTEEAVKGALLIRDKLMKAYGKRTSDI